MYKNILVPIELGQIERANEMLAAAQHLLADGGQITCLTVLPEIPGYVAAAIPEDIGDKLTKDANETLSNAVDASDVEASISVLAGHPAQTILKAAEKTNADLIVIGSHQPGLEDYLLGTTASRVVRHATCHVLVQR